MIYRQSNFRINPFFGILFLAVFFIAMYYIIKGFLYVLYTLAPLMVIAVLILDYKLLLNHFKKLIQRTAKEPISGGLWLIVNILGLPFVAAWLLIVALLNKKTKQFQQQANARKEAEYTSYEIIEEDLLQSGKEKSSSTRQEGYWKL
jgi:hypothetical protein